MDVFQVSVDYAMICYIKRHAYNPMHGSTQVQKLIHAHSIRHI